MVLFGLGSFPFDIWVTLYLLQASIFLLVHCKQSLFQLFFLFFSLFLLSFFFLFVPGMDEMAVVSFCAELKFCCSPLASFFTKMATPSTA